MRHDVIMPALGMAQDSGHLLAWRKSLGDPVRVGEVLMEVETDKAAMEVEAAHDGFLAEILAEAGTDIPVGEVIARIAEDRSDIKATPAPPEPAKEAGPKPVPPVAEAAVAAIERQAAGMELAKSAPAPRRETRSGSEPVLASPKAKFEAHRRGIALADLRRQGIAEPFHLADIERFVPPAAMASSMPSRLKAECARPAFEDFLAWTARETDGKAGSMAVWSAFAAGSLRHALPEPPEAGIVVRHIGPSGEEASILDADLTGLSAAVPAREDALPAMTVIDLRGTAAGVYAPPSAPVPMLVVSGKSEEVLLLALYFSEDRLPLRLALTLLDGLAARVSEPLRHLL